MVLGFGFSGSDLASGFSDLESGSKVKKIICFMSALQNQKKRRLRMLSITEAAQLMTT
jgi:hypothetical protein